MFVTTNVVVEREFEEVTPIFAAERFGKICGAGGVRQIGIFQMHQSHRLERTSLLKNGSELIEDEGVEISLQLFIVR